MEWLANNWFFVLILAAFVALHFFGHGHHGGHGGQSGHGGCGGHDHGRKDPTPEDHTAHGARSTTHAH